jgi:hypothetical protein
MDREFHVDLSLLSSISILPSNNDALFEVHGLHIIITTLLLCELPIHLLLVLMEIPNGTNIHNCSHETFHVIPVAGHNVDIFGSRPFRYHYH